MHPSIHSSIQTLIYTHSYTHTSTNLHMYGRIILQINSVLNFAASVKTPLNLFVVGAADTANSHYAALTSTSLSKTYDVYSSAAASAIRVTLVWTDYPGPSSAPTTSSPMINHLTLSVSSSRFL